jgi:hypothetical protein
MNELNNNEQIMTNNINNDDDVKNKNINIIMRQTGMTYEEALQKLDKNDNDYIKVLYEYYDIKKSNSVKDKTSVNQMIYKEIRNYMNIIDNMRKTK